MTTNPSEQQQALYRPAFVRNCMTLISRAHAVLPTQSLRDAEEPHITGELVRAAQELIEAGNAGAWMEYLEVKDDPPQNIPDRFGKRRPRIDIEFVQTGFGRRPRFQVEAKRFYRSDSVNEYFGTGGLKMFLDGTYAAGWSSAGMLGYVQTESSLTWLDRMSKWVAGHCEEVRLGDNQPMWESAGWSGDGLDETRVSRHKRSPEELGPISIFHLLLAFQ